MNIHFIPNGEDTFIMFLPEALKFYQVNGNTKRLVDEFLKGTPMEEIISRFEISKAEFDQIWNTVFSAPTAAVIPTDDDTLYKLILNVTNVCNLNCRYCYAGGGNYRSAEGLMDIDIAKQAVDLFYSKFKRISLIQFFGGEPLLNEPVIRFVCEYITSLYDTGKIEHLPLFGTISNGTIFSEELAETIKKYNISLTLSIDGPKDVHDCMRVFNCGRGTYDTISETISRFRDSNVHPTMVEATYNIAHEQKGYSVKDTVKHIKEECHIPEVHIVPVTGNEKYALSNLDSFVDSVSEVFREKAETRKDYSYSLINRIVDGLKKRKTAPYFCTAGVSSLSVSSKGDLYPCFMFTDNPDFFMGSIFEGRAVFDNPRFLAIREKSLAFSKFEAEQCRDCFNNRICTGCLGENYYSTGDAFHTAQDTCDMNKAMTEQVLIALSNIKYHAKK
ncbi:MAG: radical SAM protein [Oscillospiraceae bacterium]|nr:radical SAM protein [Oscillospiraceae bacterium]